MRIKQSRIIIDTNLWISYLITKGFKRLDRLIFNNEARLIFSQELINEFIQVSERKKFSKYFDKKDIIKLLELFDTYGELVNVTSKVKSCRDIKDNFLLSLSLDGKADYLITGDSDLLDLEIFGKVRIMTISEFESIF
jgi:uncharacterized protein